MPIGPSGTATLYAQGGYTLYAVDSGSGSIDAQRVTITNQREVPVSVRLTRPGWPDLTSAETILASILHEGMSDEAKALAIYDFLRDWRYHWHPPDEEDNHDPVKMVGVYGYGYCDDAARSLAQLARKAGLKARVWELEGHVVSEVLYEGRWHMLDVDLGETYRHPLGHLASVEEIARNPHWIEDPHVRGAYASTENNFVSPGLPSLSHELRLPLHPGDSATFATGRADAPPPATVRPPRAVLGDPPRVFGVGRLVRRLAPGDHLVEIPYVLLGGRIKAATCCLRGSVAFGDWRLHRAFDLQIDGEGKLANLGQLVAAQGTALYQVWLNVNAPIDLELDFQFAPRSIPWLTPGTAQFEVFVENLQPETCTKTGGACQGGEEVEIVHEVEVRSARPKIDEVFFGRAPANGEAYRLGERIDLSVDFDRPVAVTGTPQLALTIGQRTMQLPLFRFVPPARMRFRHVVRASDFDADGVSVFEGALTLNGGAVNDDRDATVAADIRLGRHAFTNASRHRVDGQAGPFAAPTSPFVQTMRLPDLPQYSSFSRRL